MVWCQPTPRTGMLGSFRNEGKLYVHALLILPFVPWSVSPWLVTSQILGHTSQCCFITKCCHMADKTPCSLHFAVSPFSLSSLSHAIQRFHSFCLSGGQRLPCVILHAYNCTSREDSTPASCDTCSFPSQTPATHCHGHVLLAVHQEQRVPALAASGSTQDAMLSSDFQVLGCSFLCSYPVTIWQLSSYWLGSSTASLHLPKSGSSGKEIQRDLGQQCDGWRDLLEDGTSSTFTFTAWSVTESIGYSFPAFCKIRPWEKETIWGSLNVGSEEKKNSLWALWQHAAIICLCSSASGGASSHANHQWHQPSAAPGAGLTLPPPTPSSGASPGWLTGCWKYNLEDITLNFFWLYGLTLRK